MAERELAVYAAADGVFFAELNELLTRELAVEKLKVMCAAAAAV